MILPSPGWILADQKLSTTDDEKNSNKIEHGTHGYDPYASKKMQTIFFALGPAFKRGVTMEPFESVNVYPLLAHLLGIKPRPNNGSLSVFKHVLKEWNTSLDEIDNLHFPVGYIKHGTSLVWLFLPVIAFTLLACVFVRLFFKKKNIRYMRVPLDSM